MKTVHAYIVFDETYSDALVLLERDNSIWKGVPKGGVLLRCPRTVTSFLSRSAARAAIARTNSYMIALGSRPRAHEYTIRRLIQ